MRAESALTLRALAEIDPTCVGGLVNYGVTTLKAIRENVSFEKVWHKMYFIHKRLEFNQFSPS